MAEPLCLAFPGGAWERGGWGWWVLRLGAEWIGEPDANAWRLIWGGLLGVGLRVVARRSRCVWRSQAERRSVGARGGDCSVRLVTTAECWSTKGVCLRGGLGAVPMG